MSLVMMAQKRRWQRRQRKGTSSASVMWCRMDQRFLSSRMVASCLEIAFGRVVVSQKGHFQPEVTAHLFYEGEIRPDVFAGVFEDGFDGLPPPSGYAQRSLAQRRGEQGAVVRSRRIRTTQGSRRRGTACWYRIPQWPSWRRWRSCGLRCRAVPGSGGPVGIVALSSGTASRSKEVFQPTRPHSLSRPVVRAFEVRLRDGHKCEFFIVTQSREYGINRNIHDAKR